MRPPSRPKARRPGPLRTRDMAAVFPAPQRRPRAGRSHPERFELRRRGPATAHPLRGPRASADPLSGVARDTPTGPIRDTPEALPFRPRERLPQPIGPAMRAARLAGPLVRRRDRPQRLRVKGRAQRGAQRSLDVERGWARRWPDRNHGSDRREDTPTKSANGGRRQAPLQPPIKTPPRKRVPTTRAASLTRNALSNVRLSRYPFRE